MFAATIVLHSGEILTVGASALAELETGIHSAHRNRATALRAFLEFENWRDPPTSHGSSHLQEPGSLCDSFTAR